VNISSFCYLGHIISDTSCDIEDIRREIKSMFFRTNVSIRKFSKCSHVVKCTLFRSYCLSLYNIGLWHNFTVTSINKFKSCYNKYLKSLFGYRRSYSLTQVLLELVCHVLRQLCIIAVVLLIVVGKIVQMRLFVIIRLCGLHNIF